MTIGERIRSLREERKYTQEKLAQELDVSFQAISSWERDEYKPDSDNLLKLAKLFDVSLSQIVEDKKIFETTKMLFDWQHMKTYIKTSCNNYHLKYTLDALETAIKAHDKQTRKKSDVPYIYHPLNMTCHLLALNIIDDDILAATLLHDVIEDTSYTFDDLNINDHIKELIILLTYQENDNEKKNTEEYYHKISLNSEASLIKCIDRINNLTTMSWGLTRDKIYHYIEETETYYPKLLLTLKNDMKYNNISWLLKYQLLSM